MVYASSSTSWPANPPPQAPRKNNITCLECLGFCGFVLVILYFLLAYIIVLGSGDDSTSVGGLPVVSIGYITISLHNDSINPGNMVMSDWGVGFSVENQKPGSTLSYGDFNVSIQFDTGISTVGIVPGLQQNESDVARFNTTVQALLAPHNATSYEVRFGVSFLSKVIEVTMSEKIKNEAQLFNGTCANMTITMQGTHGIVGGPVRCLDPREWQHRYGTF